MLTTLGKFLRTIRLDRDEVMKMMADKLGVSSAFLSAVEHGKKQMPSTWQTLLPREYAFSDEEKKRFDEVVASSVSMLQVDLAGLEDEQKNLVVMFARTLPGLSKQKVRSVYKVIQENS